MAIKLLNKGNLPTVPFTGRRPLSDLNFRPFYRRSEFDNQHFLHNRQGRLEKICMFLDWARSRSSNKDGFCVDVPLEVEAVALKAKGFEVQDAVKIRMWANDNRFIVASNGGDWHWGGKSKCGKSKTYYVDHMRIKAFFWLLRDKGRLPQGIKWKWQITDPKVQERAIKKLERSAKRYESERAFLDAIKDIKVFQDICVPVLKKYDISPTERLAAILHFATSNSELYAHTQQQCIKFNSYNANQTISPSHHQATIQPPASTSSTPVVPPPVNEYLGKGESSLILGNLGQNRQLGSTEPPEKQWEKKDAENQPFSLHLNPNVRMSSNAIAKMVSYRVFSPLAQLKGHDKSNHGKWETCERKYAMDALFGEGGYARIDRKASIHQLTMSVNRGHYFRDSEIGDLYDTINRDATGYSVNYAGYPEDYRKQFKQMLNRIYFTDSAELYACQMQRSEGSFGDFSRRTALMDEYRAYRASYERICGKPRGTAVFGLESLLMVSVANILLERYGLRSVNIYDELVIETKGVWTEEQLRGLVEDASVEVFGDVLECSRLG